MPYPRANETKKKYIPRAIKYFVESEGKTQKQAVGAAFGFWKTYGHSKKKKRK
jgi:hypothetical protein